MRLRGIATVLALGVSWAEAQSTEELARRFASSYLMYLPGSAIDVRIDHNGTTAAGSYLALTALRTSAQDKDSEQLGLLMDPGARAVAAGPVFPLPVPSPPVTLEKLGAYVESTLPQLLGEVLTARVRVRFPAGPFRTPAVVPLTAEMSTGYGWAAVPVAISADARYLALGTTWDLGRDVRVARRELLESTAVQWDPGNEGAIVKVVEFSDFQCPACKRGWSEMKPVLAEFGDTVRHGMVNYPLVRNHPWAFRAAVGGSCVASAWPEQFLNFKEELYRLQDSLTVASVDEAVFAFLGQRQLDEKTFRACYLKDPSIDAVLRQMALGQRLGVMATPIYFANGEPLPFGKKEWAVKRLRAIAAAGGKPEAAAEIQP